MVRLLLLLAPAASITAAVSVRASIGWVAKVALAIPENVSNEDDAVSATSGNNAISSTQKEAERKKQRLLKLRNQGFQQPGAQVVTSSSGNITTVPAGKGSGSNLFAEIIQPIEKEAAQSPGMRMWVGLGVTFMLGQFLFFFVIHSSKMAQALSEPQIITRRSTNDGGMEILDDFREAYWWLRDETPEDSRVLAWWDYGYQINGIGNRTTLADGNTWNHEHIALIGRVLVSNEEHAYDIAKHLADYVLVWSTSFAGMRGDDLAKMPHMARIAGSVFDDINGAGYYLQGQDNPSPLMGESLLYKLHSAGIKDDVPMPTLFEEAYTSKNQMVRIWKVLDPSKESKEFCKFYHRYPPALSDVLAKKQDFKQIHGIFSSN
jgi:dolichyl-diphosphooligosaccharide--protein glycosyltransferase